MYIIVRDPLCSYLYLFVNLFYYLCSLMHILFYLLNDLQMNYDPDRFVMDCSDRDDQLFGCSQGMVS